MRDSALECALVVSDVWDAAEGPRLLFLMRRCLPCMLQIVGAPQPSCMWRYRYDTYRQTMGQSALIRVQWLVAFRNKFSSNSCQLIRPIPTNNVYRLYPVSAPPGPRTGRHQLQMVRSQLRCTCHVTCVNMHSCA